MFIHKNIKILTWFNFLTDFRLYAPIAIFSLGIGFFADRIGGAKALIIINVIQFIPIFLYLKLRSYSKNEKV